MKNSNLQWFNAVRSLKYALVLTDREGYIIDYNELWLQLGHQNNVSPEFNWQGINLIQIVENRSNNGDPLAQYCMSKLDDLLQGIDSFEPVQYVNSTTTGTQRLILDSSPLLDLEGLVQGIVISVHDISSLHTTSSSCLEHLDKPSNNRLLPMCAVCKRIRDSQEQWHSLESYMKHHLQIEFTHDICTECIGHLYPQYASLLEAKKGKQEF